jgi:hypothetical protein
MDSGTRCGRRTDYGHIRTPTVNGKSAKPDQIKRQVIDPNPFRPRLGLFQRALCFFSCNSAIRPNIAQRDGDGARCDFWSGYSCSGRIVNELR